MKLEKVKNALNLSQSNTLDEFLNELLDVYIKQHEDGNFEAEEEIYKDYVMKWGDSKQKNAKGFSKDKKEITIVAGSDFANKHTDSLSKSYIDLREKLIEEGIINTSNPTKYFFDKDYLFPSFSTAASVIRGVQLNGVKWFKEQ